MPLTGTAGNALDSGSAYNPNLPTVETSYPFPDPHPPYTDMWGRKYVWCSSYSAYVLESTGCPPPPIVPPPVPGGGSAGSFVIPWTWDPGVPELPTPTGSTGGAEGMPPAPVASFSSMLLTGRRVQFINTSTGDPTNYFWSFGDGDTVEHPILINGVQTPMLGNIHPMHTYAADGTYTVTLTVRTVTPIGYYESSAFAYVSVVNESASVDFTYTIAGYRAYFWYTGNVPGEVLWQFGDGTEYRADYLDGIWHEYDGAGTYTVTVSIAGTSATKQVTIDVGIKLTWSDESADETGFAIQLYDDGTSSWITIDTVAAGVTEYTVTAAVSGVSSEEVHGYRVVAVNANGNSDPTNELWTSCGKGDI